MSKTNPARGMRDFLPADVRKRNYVINVIREVYESYGFEPLETPAVENLETLMGKYGEEGNQLIFKILKRGEAFAASLKGFAGTVKAGTYSTYEENDPSYATAITREYCDLALRYDLTVPLARVVANKRNELPKFFKRYQIQPVWRADRPARGRYREFYQCDVDAIGSTSMAIEAELISAVSKILTSLGFNDFLIRANHRELLQSILNAANVPEDKLVPLLTSLDKLDKIGTAGVIYEFEKLGISPDVFKKFFEPFAFFANVEGKQQLNLRYVSIIDPSLNAATINKLANYLNHGASQNSAIVDLDRIYSLALKGDAGRRLFIDPTLVRGLSYYTGAIFEVTLTEGDFAGSIAGGGRYDGLIGMFGKEQIPACGLSLGLERILVVMDERGMFPPEIAESTPADVMVTVWSEETIDESLKLASELRSQGLRVTLYPEVDKFGKQMKYADTIRVPYVCVLGESEIAEGKVTVKNMKTGEQETVDRDRAVSTIKT